MKKDYWYLPFLALAMVISFYIRVINPWNDVFTWTVKLSGNDPWYYYRLIENCIRNFPNRIWFDSFTNYPYGTYTHFGPFLVYFSSLIAIAFGEVHGEALRSILVFIPAIAGILITLPMFLFSSQVFNKRVGVISSLLIAMIPGQFLQRSILSFNDHHCWETFWMITTLAFYVYALNVWRSSKDPFKDRKAILSAILSGIAYGMFLDTWAPSFIFAMILTMFVVISLIFEKFIDTRYLIEVTMITVAVASILYLPFAFETPYYSTTHYSPFQLVILLGCLTLLFVFKMVKYLKPYRKLRELTYPLTFIILTLISIGILAVFAPQVLNMIIGVTGVIQPKAGALTIAEVQPFFFTGGTFSLAPAWFHFGMTFFFGFFGFLYLCYLLYRERDARLLLVLMWCIILFIALCGQNRFAYYFALVCAVTSAVVLDFLLDKLNFYECIVKYIQGKRTSSFRLILSIIIIALLFYPTLSMAKDQSRYVGGINREWWDALTWLKNNTPDGNYEEYFYHLYEPSRNSTYNYPFKTYGVMSWWDYGHWIEAIAHRMPNANPFQQGIGNKYNKNPGASWFFTAFDENESEFVAESLNVKYVISDVEMLTGKFYAMATWAEGSLEKAGRNYYEGSWLVYVSQYGIGLAPTIYDVPPNARIVGSLNVPNENCLKQQRQRYTCWTALDFHITD